VYKDSLHFPFVWSSQSYLLNSTNHEAHRTSVSILLFVRSYIQTFCPEPRALCFLPPFQYSRVNVAWKVRLTPTSICILQQYGCWNMIRTLPVLLFHFLIRFSFVLSFLLDVWVSVDLVTLDMTSLYDVYFRDKWRTVRTRTSGSIHFNPHVLFAFTFSLQRGQFSR
jgi:hypothetical protein